MNEIKQIAKRGYTGSLGLFPHEWLKINGKIRSSLKFNRILSNIDISLENGYNKDNGTNAFREILERRFRDERD